jgi:hypothetical protein
MIGSVFYLAKRTDSHADGLAAAGLGHLLARIGAPTTPREVVIHDREGLYEIAVEPPLGTADIERWDGDPFYPYVKLKGDKQAPAGAFDYEKESAVLAEARKHRAKRGARKHKDAGPVLAGEDARLAEAARAADPETAFLRIFNGMRKGFKADIDLNRAIRKARPIESITERLRGLTSRGRALSIQPETAPFKVKLSASQWFLPLSGKGISRVKADGATPGQFPERLIDWFEMWLRFIGMYRSMTQHGFGDGDLKLLVLAPSEMESSLVTTVRNELRDNAVPIFGGKIDVRVPLELARSLVSHSEEYSGPSATTRKLRFAARPPRDVLTGAYVTSYKKMGTASSVMNLGFLAVPSWSVISNRADAEAFLDTLNDLDRYQSLLRDNISEDIDTLRVMRDFLSSCTLDAALRFFARVAVDVMKRRAADQYTHFLSTNSVRRVLMGLSSHASIVGQVIDNEGFQRMAKAVRAATIHAQLYRDSALQPRYGLAQAWRQKAPYKAQFVEALAQFVQQFNADVTRKRETASPGSEARFPALLTTDDLRSVLGLIEAPGSSSSLVAHLLLAFGYAQVPSKDKEKKD